MASTFIFISEVSEQAYPCLVLEANGTILEPLALRDFSSIRTLAQAHPATIVLPSTQFSLHTVELPLLNDKKLRQAVPYALEENLTQAIEELHFCYDRRYYAQGKHLVAVCAKAYFRQITTQLAAQSIPYESITLDWFALKTNQALVLTKAVLIADSLFSGALDISLANNYFLQTTKPEATVMQPIIYTCADSAQFNLPKQSAWQMQHCDNTIYEWLSSRLLVNKPMNLCQNEFVLKKGHNQLLLWYYAAAGLFSLWLILLLAVNAYQLMALNRDIKYQDQQIAVIFHHFFPDAKQIINPRFRIMQFLKSSAASRDESLWLLLSKFTKVVDNKPITLTQLNWQNNILLLTLEVDDFKELDNLQNNLKQSGLQVKQTQAASKEGKVLSTLEINL